jgi:DNA repair exonuclease SbcCD ATPase subunit
MTTCPACGRPHLGLHCSLCMPHRTQEKSRELSRQWRKDNLEKVRARDRAYRKKYRAKKLAGMKAWRQANPDKMRAYRKAWREKNPEKVRALKQAFDQAKRIKEALQAAAEAAAKPPKPLSPKLSALLKLAEVKATQARYGIQRVAFQERR